MYGSARGRQILQYKINPNPNPNPNTNPSSPYCIIRFIFGSRVHVPSRQLGWTSSLVKHGGGEQSLSIYARLRTLLQVASLYSATRHFMVPPYSSGSIIEDEVVKVMILY